MATDILLIEDDRSLGAVIKDFLEREGYLVQWCTTGEEGLTFLEHTAVKLVLLDIMLPDIDGFTVCTKIRSTQSLPVIDQPPQAFHRIHKYILAWFSVHWLFPPHRQNACEKRRRPGNGKRHSGNP